MYWYEQADFRLVTEHEITHTYIWICMLNENLVTILIEFIEMSTRANAQDLINEDVYKRRASCVHLKILLNSCYNLVV